MLRIDSFSNMVSDCRLCHRPSHECLPKRLFRRRLKKTSKLQVTGLCDGNPAVNMRSCGSELWDAVICKHLSVWHFHSVIYHCRLIEHNFKIVTIYVCIGGTIATDCSDVFHFFILGVGCARLNWQFVSVVFRVARFNKINGPTPQDSSWDVEMVNKTTNTKWSGPRFTKDSSIAIQIRWTFRFTRHSILIQLSLQLHAVQL